MPVNPHYIVEQARIKVEIERRALRDEFAKTAMVTLMRMAAENHSGQTSADVARDAYLMADAMMKAREK